MAKPASFLTRLCVLAAAAALGLAACERQVADTTPPETGDIAVARVNDQTVWLSDLKREAVAQGLIGDGEPLDVSTDLFQLVLNSVIDQKLLAAEARRLGLDKDPETQHRLQMAQDRILGDVLVEQRVQQVVTEEVIDGVYQRTVRGAPLGEEFRARQIVSATENEADAVKAQIGSGASFESLALTRSMDPDTRFKGGDLGYFTPDLLPEEYGAALGDAAVGDLVGPFQVEEQWVLLLIEDKRPEQPLSFEEARPQIVRFLTLDEVRETLENARRGAKIEILLDEAPGDRAPEPADAPPIAPGALPMPKAETPAAPTPAAPAAPAAPAPKAEPKA